MTVDFTKGEASTSGRTDLDEECARTLHNRTVPAALSPALAALMRVTGVGQDELAATIGQSPRSIALWLTGVRLPSAVSLKALSRTFGVPADWLLGADAVEIARGSRGSRRSPRRRRSRAQIRRRTKGAGDLSIVGREVKANTD